MSATKTIVNDVAGVALPGYWTEARKHLMKKDRVLKRLIPTLGDSTLESRGDAFTTLARSIVGQQIARKADYLVDLALHFDAGKLQVDAWQTMDDEAIITELIGIRGVGRWTAEMFLIFHLLRPNVLPLDDVGLINGISRNYFSGDPVSRSDAREVAEAWKPWCSVATWYIWRSLAPLPVAY